MTDEQYKKADRLKKLIDNYNGIYSMLHDATNRPNQLIEIKFPGTICRIPENLIGEFLKVTGDCLNRLQKEFDEL